MHRDRFHNKCYMFSDSNNFCIADLSTNFTHHNNFWLPLKLVKTKNMILDHNGGTDGICFQFQVKYSSLKKFHLQRIIRIKILSIQLVNIPDRLIIIYILS